MTNPLLRFSNRVDNYVKYRPHYPPEVIAVLRDECQLTPSALVADIGSGTGFLTELFLENGNRVFAVEPNREMRVAGERILQAYSNFYSVSGRAEATTLADQSVDFIVSGQAFHWFDRDRARDEFVRILKPDGWLMLAWNDREVQAKPFMEDYDRLLQRYSTDYTLVNHKQINETALADFYGAHGYKLKMAYQRQDFDYAGLQGRLLSSSYSPEPDSPQYQPMLAELARVFKEHQMNGTVAFEYTTRIYYGQLS